MNVGGPSKHVVNLAKSLEEYGFETLLISGQPEEKEGNMFELADQKGIKLKTVRFMGRSISPIKDLISLILLIKEIKSFSPDIVHTHTTKAGILGRLAALICNVPSIYHTYHGHVFKGYFSKFTSTLIVAIERFFSSFTRNIIALTPNLKNELNLILRPKSPEKIKTIPLGLDLKTNLSTPRQINSWRTSMGLSKKNFLLGIIGRLVPVKNHLLLINSIPKLVKEFPNIHLMIIGDGELRNNLEKQTQKLNLEKHIHFCGNIRNLEKVYSDLDLLVLCSKNEGTPVVLIEALASGCPVASTNVGGIEELLENGKLGRLLSSDPKLFCDNLSNAILDIKEKNFKETPTKETRNYICEKYSVEKLAENIAKLYRGKI